MGKGTRLLWYLLLNCDKPDIHHRSDTHETCPLKVYRMISRTGPFIIEEYHLREPLNSSVRYTHIQFWVVPFWSGSPSTWIRLFVTMDISAFQKFLFHQLIQRFQVSVCTVYDPVRHSLCGEIEIISANSLSWRARGIPFTYLAFMIPATQREGVAMLHGSGEGSFSGRFHGSACRTVTGFPFSL